MVTDLTGSTRLTRVNNVLVVDDEPNVVAVVQDMLSGENYNIITAYSLDEAKSIIRRQNINLVLTDLMLGDGSGMDVMHEAHQFHPESQVILMTGRPTIQNAVEVIKLGAYDYLVKPFAVETVKITLGRAAEKIRLEQENIKLRELMSFYQISEAMGSIIELDQLLNLILKTAIKEYESDVATIFYTDEEIGLYLKSSVGLGNDEFARMVTDHCYEISLQSVTGSSALIINDPELDYTWWERSIKSTMCQPLQAKGRILGTLVIVRTQNTHPFSHGQLAGLSLLSSKAATAVENYNLYENLKKTYIATVEALANAVEARDSYTRGHNERVYMLARAIAEELGLSSKQLEDLKIGALLHDIGKIGVPDSILNKPGPLTPEEAEIMKSHPATGAKMIETIEFLRPALPYILYHHERHDGAGYPLGLSGNAIPLEGRLLAVVDTIDAITSDRPYRKGRSLEVALDEIMKFSGAQFDPEVVKACFDAHKKGKLKFLFP